MNRGKALPKLLPLDEKIGRRNSRSVGDAFFGDCRLMVILGAEGDASDCIRSCYQVVTEEL